MELVERTEASVDDMTPPAMAPKPIGYSNSRKIAQCVLERNELKGTIEALFNNNANTATEYNKREAQSHRQEPDRQVRPCKKSACWKGLGANYTSPYGALRHVSIAATYHAPYGTLVLQLLIIFIYLLTFTTVRRENSHSSVPYGTARRVQRSIAAQCGAVRHRTTKLKKFVTPYVRRANYQTENDHHQLGYVRIADGILAAQKCIQNGDQCAQHDGSLEI
uniref:Uncharacterized protein n=1 Tax=Romanomermis culicivorax TaxID=13658 RepID=A0A915HUQ3_ROMCU